MGTLECVSVCVLIFFSSTAAKSLLTKKVDGVKVSPSLFVLCPLSFVPCPLSLVHSLSFKFWSRVLGLWTSDVVSDALTSLR